MNTLTWGGAAVIFAVMVVLAGWMFIDTDESVSGKLVLATGPLEQTVMFTGVVAPQDRVTLGFERSGRVTTITADVGARVLTGGTIATLASGDAYAALQIAEASLAREEARLEKLERGATNLELAVSEAKVASSQGAERDTQEALVSELGDAYTTVDSAIHTTADVMFTRPRVSPDFIYDISDQQLVLNIENGRYELEHVLGEWKQDLDTLYQYAGRTLLDGSNFGQDAWALQLGAAAIAHQDPLSTTALDTYTKETRTRLLMARAFFGFLAAAIPQARVIGSMSASTADTYAASVAADRAAIDAALAALDASSKAYTGAVQARRVAEADYTLLSSGTRDEDVLLQRAAVSAERAKVVSAQVELAKYTLIAPYDGVVTEVTIDPGELVTAQQGVVTLDSDGVFSVEARVSELDVVTLRPGLSATVTLDAYGTYETFDAVVQTVDESETEKDGLLGYRVVLVFSQPDMRLRAGLTANATVRIIVKESVIAVPRGYVGYRDGDAYVRRLEEGTPHEVMVQIGTILPDGITEIVSGVTEGEALVPYDTP